MHVTDFLAHLSQNFSILQSYSVIHFFGAEYQLLFNAYSAQALRQHASIPISFLDLTQHDIQYIKGQLETSFLGQKMIYWLQGCVDLDSTKNKEIFTYINGYQGSHLICVYTAQPINHPRVLRVELPDSLDRKGCIALAHAMGLSNVASNFSFLNHIFARVKTISLDQALILFEYGQFLGSHTEKFCEQWLDRIIIAEHSLFSLSQAFFAKNEKEFFMLWHEMHELYSLPFWITYWSEQIFRAIAVIECYKVHDVAGAKKMGYRLPFSFLQKDFKRSSVVELKKAHDFIYSIDHAFKNGGQAPALDVLYAKYFLGEFR